MILKKIKLIKINNNLQTIQFLVLKKFYNKDKIMK